ncbi:MAG: DUF4150 domain-containing protein [Burkholderiaceae bacterium]
MPVTIKVNGVANSLVHKGSNGISIATIPDVCKTPSPAGPVPIPYPNISQSITLDKGTTTVKADGGMMVATKGSEFSLSNGDNAGVAGGVKSSTFMKESTWILYSFDVKMDGSNACRLTDKKFQNHENTADLSGEVQEGVVTVMLVCGECDSYSKLQKKRAQAQNEGEQDFERDHIPAKATLRERAFKKAGPGITDSERDCIAGKVESRGIAVAIPKSAHRGFSPTCGNRNKALIAHDSASKENMVAAVDRDLAAMKAHLKGTDCESAYDDAANKIKEHDNEKMMDQVIDECTGG